MSNTEPHPDELLPWLANDTLAGEERARLEAHLESCARCREELAFLRALRHSVKRLGGESPGELVRERLLREIGRGSKPHRWWIPALAAAAVVIVAQGAILANLLWTREPAITPLGERMDGAVLQVRFRATATEAQMRAALQEIGGAIVDGPGALGVYRVRLQGERPASAADIEQAVQQLKQRTDTVEHVARE